MSDDSTLDAINAIMSAPPHKVTLREVVPLVTTTAIDPFTRRIERRIELNPTMRAGLEQNGYDADEYLTAMVQILRDNGIEPLD